MKRSPSTRKFQLVLSSLLVLFLLTGCAGKTKITSSQDQSAPANPVASDTEPKLTDGGELVTDSASLIHWSVQTVRPAPGNWSYNELRTFQHEDKIWSADISASGNRIITGGADSTAKLWKASTGEVLQTFEHSKTVRSVAISPAGDRFLTGSWDNTAKLWNSSTNEPIHTLKHASWVWVVAFSPSGKQVVTGGYDDTAKLWEASTGRHLRTFKHSGAVFDVSFSPTGETLITGSKAGQAKLWQTSTGKNIRTINTKKIVGAVDYSPKKDLVMVGGSFNAAKLYKTTTGQLLRTFEHPNGVRKIDFSPSGDRVLTACADNTARLWSTSSGKLLHTFEHSNDVVDVAFSKTGNRILTASHDKMAKLWSVPPGIPGFHLVQQRVQNLLEQKLDKPVVPELTRNEFESEAEFQERVKKARGRYKESVAKYRKKASALIPRLTRNTFLRVFGKPELTNVKYNLQTRTFHMDLVSDRKWAENFSRSLVLRKEIGDPGAGKQFKNKLKNAAPEVFFEITETGLQWNKAQVTIEDTTYKLVPTEEDFEPESYTTQVVLENLAPDQRVEVNLELSEDPEVRKLQKKLRKTRREEQKKHKIAQLKQKLRQLNKKETDYQDDLPELLKQAPEVPTSQDRYLFAVGIEEYSAAPNVPFADRSTKFFRRVAHKRLGIPNDSSHMLIMTNTGATAGSLQGRLATLLNRLDNNDELYFYYAGHGVPARQGKGAYLLPQDAVQGYYQYETFRLANLYQQLANSRAGRVIAFVDACFSGQAGKEKMVFEGVAPAGRMVSNANVKQAVPENMTVITAGTSSQFSNSYKRRGYRLFSYFVMKGLLKGKSGKTLTKYVKSKVNEVSRNKGPNYNQTPQVYGNKNIDF